MGEGSTPRLGIPEVHHYQVIKTLLGEPLRLAGLGGFLCLLLMGNPGQFVDALGL